MIKFKALFNQSGFLGKLVLFSVLISFFSVMFAVISKLLVTGNAGDINHLRWEQLIQSFGMFVLPPLVFAYLVEHRPTEFLGLNRAPKFFPMALVILLIFISMPGINLIISWNQQIHLPESLSNVEKLFRDVESFAEALTKKLLAAKTIDVMLFNILVVAIIPAIGEELFFRGVIQKILSTQIGIHAAIWTSAVVFSAFHFQFFGFVPRMLLGAMFGYLFAWTGNIWYPILAHFINNATAIILFYLYQNHSFEINLEKFGSDSTYVYGYVSLLFTLLTLYAFRSLFLVHRR